MFSIFDFFGYELPLKERYPLIKSAGFNGTALWWGDDFGRIDYRDSPAHARKAGLIVENVHLPYEGINNLWLDTADGEALTEYLLRCAADCADNEIPTMVMHLSSGNDPPPFNNLGMDRIKRIVEKSERHGINITFENLRKPEYLAFVLDNIESPRVGFCYDSGHDNCYYSKDDLLDRHGSRLMALHLHDNDGAADQHLLPFDGSINWPVVMKKIAASGYTGSISLEADNLGYENLPAEDFLRLAFERAEKLAAMKLR